MEREEIKKLAGQFVAVDLDRSDCDYLDTDLEPGKHKMRVRLDGCLGGSDCTWLIDEGGNELSVYDRQIVGPWVEPTTEPVPPMRVLPHQPHVFDHTIEIVQNGKPVFAVYFAEHMQASALHAFREFVAHSVSHAIEGA